MNTEKKNFSNFKFNLTGIELVHSSLLQTELHFQEKQTFNFGIKIEQKINVSKKMIIIAPEIEIHNEDKKILLGTLKIACLFSSENLSDFTIEQDKVVSLPEEISSVLNSVSISTARGIMFSEFRGTALHSAFLPVVEAKRIQ